MIPGIKEFEIPNSSAAHTLFQTDSFSLTLKKIEASNGAEIHVYCPSSTKENAKITVIYRNADKQVYEAVKHQFMEALKEDNVR
jgi:hypothetical protein